ncbi:uncharacterized protein M6B38_257185 [Iris pallida]|uniref:RRM domain-containing protein n=1 Tax=Iris pallida TaxID=29817 RepID=A0AAX6IF74_IRIPA|nr:uncharacterized protein M6B38_257185 [Iris pallida]
MSRSDRRKETARRSSNEGTAARTRPYSFEDIISKRKKKLDPDAKKRVNEIREPSEKGHAIGALEHDSDGSPPKKNNSLKSGRKKLEAASSKKEQDHLEVKDKGISEYEVKMKVKSSYSKGTTDRRSKNEDQYDYRSRTDNRFGSGSERVSEKKRNEVLVDKDRHEERERKSRKEGKRKHESRIDDKTKSEIDSSASKKRDSGKLRDAEYKVRTGRRKEHSPTYHEESRSKRRRSKSQDYNRERDKSASSSPREHRHPYHGRDFDESPFQSIKDKSRRKHSDTDNYRSSGNVGYTGGHYRKHGSGLGGYSPRKRRTGAAAVKTPSPTIRSPERKSSTWDQPPAGTSNADPGSTQFNFQSSTSKMLELVSSTLATPAVTKPQPAPSLDSVTTLINASIDSVQLTQATRPLRRLYVENLPPTASEKSVTNSLNELLLSSHVNHIQGVKPCISCIINKEKCQAVVEFLTPEDATTALSLDGKSISGSVIKLRRPKDFVEAPTGSLGKTVPVVKVISDAVKDSPNKIFVGGISRALSSDMFMKIAGAFGILKAYYFEFNEELNGPCAFLEYEDQSVTQRACAGLNGMKLAGQVLTAVQALPDSHEDVAESLPTYGIPPHARSLLAISTQVLQLKNLFKAEEFLLLSESDVEETMEDIKLECARFGTIKSVNVVRYKSSNEVVSEANGISNKIESGTEGLSIDCEKNRDENEPPLKKAKDLQDISTGNKNCDDGCHLEIVSNDLNAEGRGHAVQVDGVDDPSKFDDGCHDEISSKDLTMEDPRDAVRVDGVDQHPNSTEVEDTKMEESPGAESGLASEIQLLEIDGTHEAHSNLRADPSNASIDHVPVETTYPKEGEASDVGGGDLPSLDGKPEVFEPGCVLVEFSRKESACVAAHCLHGRLYGERMVSVAYVPHDLYLSRFPR